MTQDLTVSELHQLLTYDGDTGVFTWLPRFGTSRADKIFNSKYAMKVAGCVCPKGYGYIRIRGKGFFSAHRLAWFYKTGAWPKEEIDHKNGDPTDNSFKNLREATRAQNASNRGVQSNSQSGVKGVYYRPDKKKWTAQVAMNRVVRKLGYFATKAEASAAYKAAAARVHGEYQRLA